MPTPASWAKSVKLSGKPVTVIGVMPAAFTFPEEMGADMKRGAWLPLQPTSEMLNDRGYHFFNVVGVLRQGVVLVQAQKELDAIAAHIPVSDAQQRQDRIQRLPLPGSSHRAGEARCSTRSSARLAWCS